MPVPARPPALILDRLSVGYGRKPVLCELSGRVEEGELLALVGPNGAGKSTLLATIAGLNRPSAGAVQRGSGRIAYLPQLAAVDSGFPINVADFVAMGLWHDIGALTPIGPSHRAQVDQALVRVGLQGSAAKPIGALSGGQLRRALFARLMLQDAALILLDEPFAALDAATTAQFIAIIGEWHREGRTVIAALHDLRQVRAHFPRTLLLSGKVIAWDDTATALSEANLAAADPFETA
jgi:zinc/manganese transport system ATP-binding protein